MAPSMEKRHGSGLVGQPLPGLLYGLTKPGSLLGGLGSVRGLDGAREGDAVAKGVRRGGGGALGVV